MATESVLNPKRTSSFQGIIKTVFYGNNVRKVNLRECYELARKQPGVIVTDHPMYKAEAMGLPSDAKVLVVNDGAILGRTAKARVLVPKMGSDAGKYETILREAVYDMGNKPLIYTNAYMGLDPDCMIKVHYLTTERHAINALNVCLNFQHETPEYIEAYSKSVVLEGETDVIMIADPDWKHPDFPIGLVIIDPEHNAVAVLGLRYFGEMKKNLLTFGWTIGVRAGMVACHAGIKEFHLAEGNTSMAVFGLSGSGKSSLTNSAFHEGAIKTESGENVTVIHDDAFNIDMAHKKSIVLEPNLFDKTDATQEGSKDIDFWMTAMNQMVAENEEGRKVIFPTDIRNRNGRAIKSREWLLNLADTGPSPNYVCYLMKDTTLPPITFISNHRLAVAMGASLATMRTSAENVAESEMNRLVFEPFANPFRVYPLTLDCERFEELFKRGAVGIILNTHKFYGANGKEIDIPKELTLPMVVHLARGKMEAEDWPVYPGLQIPKKGSLTFLDNDYDDKYTPPKEIEYYRLLQKRTQQRINFLADLAKQGEIQERFVDSVRLAMITMDDHIREMEKSILSGS
ncbi:MAG: phosphoenolpyruvate carboxykinase (ATP) [Desulfomonilaceae bacterium]